MENKHSGSAFETIYDSKDIYLTKDGQIIGLHAIGHNEPYEFKLVHLDGTEELIKTDFMEIEKWGNQYNSNGQMIGRGSFRIFALTLEHAAKEFEEDGWTRVDCPFKSETLESSN